MSRRLFKEDVLFVQRFLRSSGFYRGKLDGVWDRATDRAFGAFEAASTQLSEQLGRYDSRTETHIRSLHVAAQDAARTLVGTLHAAGIDARIISGTRTYKEQNELFRRGRYGNPGPRVTRARGGSSAHNFAIAWDLGLFDKGRYITQAGPYEEAASLALVDGLRWGGTWTAFKDRPHYELVTGYSLKEIRARFERGEAYV